MIFYLFPKNESLVLVAVPGNKLCGRRFQNSIVYCDWDPLDSLKKIWGLWANPLYDFTYISFKKYLGSKVLKTSCILAHPSLVVLEGRLG